MFFLIFIGGVYWGILSLGSLGVWLGLVLVGLGLVF